jgi:hypothetical protein
MDAIIEKERVTKIYKNTKKIKSKEYRNKNRVNINKNKILTRVRSGNKINQKTVDTYKWTDIELKLLTPLIRNKTKKKKQEEPISIPNPLNLSIKDIIDIINTDDKIKQSSRDVWIQHTHSVFKMFNEITEVTNFCDIFNKYTDEEILKVVQNKYPNLGTQVKMLQLILKLYSLSPEFSVFLTETRHNTLKDFTFEADNQYRADRITTMKKTNIDYTKEFIDVFKSELILRQTQAGSNNHLVSIMYSIGCYSDASLSPDSLKFTPRGNELLDIKLVKKDDEIVDDKMNYFNQVTGRLVINSLKTDSVFSYDYVMNDVALKYIKLNILKRPNNKRDKLIYVKKKAFDNIKTKYVGLNHNYRKMVQNVYVKIFKRDIASLSRVFSHTVEQATNYYIDGLEYTDVEVSEKRESIEKQLVLNSVM